jgi:hypothetical protein
MGVAINRNHLLVGAGVFSMSYIKRDITLVNYMRRCVGPTVGSLNSIVRYIWMFLIWPNYPRVSCVLHFVLFLLSLFFLLFFVLFFLMLVYF